MKKKYFSICLIIFLISANFLFGQNQFEPNNTFADAQEINLGVVNQAAIQVAFDKDYFKFEVPTEGVIKVQVSDISSDYDMDIYLYNDDNSLSEIEYTDTPNSQMTSSIIQKTCTPGTHYLLFKDGLQFGENDFSDQLYSFVVTLDTSDIHETNFCNDDFASAVSINLGEVVQGAIYDEFDLDYFKFEVPTEGVIKVQVSDISSDYDMDIYLYNDDNSLSEIEYTDTPNSQTTSSLIEKTCTPGTHYLLFKDGLQFGENDFSDQLYSFVVTLDTSDIHETNFCNDDFASAVSINLGEVVQGAIYDEFDLDYFKFEVPTEGVIKVQVSDISSDYDMDIYLYNDDNSLSEIEYTDTPNSQTTSSLIEKTCTPGTHYLLFKDGLQFGENDFSDQLYSFVVTLDTSDIYETNFCNDDIQHAFPLEQICSDTFFAAINDIGDQDYFQFTAPENSIIDVSVKNIASTIDMRIELTNGINTVSDQANNGAPVSINLENTSQSTYTLHLHDNGDNNFDESFYQLCIQILPQVNLDIPNSDFCIDDLPASLTGGTPVSGIYSGPGVDAFGNFDPSTAGVGQHEITYTYMDINTSCSNQTSQTVFVYDLPNGSFMLPNDMVFVTAAPFLLQGGLPLGGVYSGMGVDSNSGEFDPSTGVGNYEITYTIDNAGCSVSIVDTMVVTQITNVISIAPDISITVTPNPFSENIRIEFDEWREKEIGVTVYNLNGIPVYQSAQKGQEIFEMNLDAIPSGIYILTIAIDETRYTTKIVKQN